MQKFLRISLFIIVWMILNFAFFVAEGAGRPRPGTLIPSFFITFFLFSILKKFPLSKKNVFDKNELHLAIIERYKSKTVTL